MSCWLQRVCGQLMFPKPALMALSEIKKETVMMPFAVLRTWILGPLGWIVLGLGIYLLYEWSDGVTPPRSITIAVDESRSLDADQTDNKTVVILTENDRVDNRGGIYYLAWGLGLTLVSIGGIVPILPFLGRPPLFEPKSFTGMQELKVSRPDGSLLHIEHCGPENGLTLIFTHGWSLDRSDWYFAQKALSTKYHLVFWDLAGLGKSTSPRNHDHSLEKMAADLEAVMGAVTPGPVVLIGHSIGGMIQQVFCRLYPQHLEDRVLGLVLVHTTYMNPVKTAYGSVILSALQKPVIEPLNYLMIWLSPLAWISNWQSYWNGSLHLTSRLTSFAGQQTWGQIDHSSRLAAKASPAVVARGNQAMLRFDERATLPHIHRPVLVVSGANDRLTMAEASHTIAKLLPDAREITLTPAGHLGHWEQHEQFEAALTDFITTLERGQPRLNK